MRLIGDRHGLRERYADIIADCDRSVQVGDFGLGFRSPHEDQSDLDFMKSMGDHRFIRGNHDDPERCRRTDRWIPDGTIEDDIMFIGGARSIDQAYRVAGLDWWEAEECSQRQLGYFIRLYEDVRPRVMVTHDCPDTVARRLFDEWSPRLPSRTRWAFDMMLERHRPDAWIFGHWHRSLRQTIKGTDFLCLDELEVVDIDG